MYKIIQKKFIYAYEVFFTINVTLLKSFLFWLWSKVIKICWNFLKIIDWTVTPIEAYCGSCKNLFIWLIFHFLTVNSLLLILLTLICCIERQWLFLKFYSPLRCYTFEDFYFALLCFKTPLYKPVAEVNHQPFQCYYWVLTKVLWFWERVSEGTWQPRFEHYFKAPFDIFGKE